jgi:hypothetical protein
MRIISQALLLLFLHKLLSDNNLLRRQCQIKGFESLLRTCQQGAEFVSDASGVF